MAIHQSPNQSDLAAYKEAIAWYKWLTIVCANWPNDVDPRPAKHVLNVPARSRRKAAKKEEKGEEVKLITAAKRSATEMFSGVSSSAATHVGLQPSCSPTGRAQNLVGIIEDKALHLSHCFRLTGSLVWCNHCGSYGQERFKALKDKCGGPQNAKSKAGQLAQLRKGRHPLSGEVIGKLATSSATIPTARTVASTARSSSSSARHSLPTCSARHEVPKSAAARAGATKRLVLAVPTKEVSRSTFAQGSSKGVRALVAALSRPTYRFVGYSLGKLV